MERETITRAWRRGQEGWPAAYPVMQFPNAPLLVALAASVLGRVCGDAARPYFDATFALLAAVWAYLELTAGSNAFRRVLGAGFLVYLVVRVGSRLG